MKYKAWGVYRIDDPNELYGWSDDKDAAEMYAFRLNKSTKSDIKKQYSIQETNDKDNPYTFIEGYLYFVVRRMRMNNPNEYDNTYLVRLNDTYVPIYLVREMKNLMSDIIEDDRFAIDILSRELERCNLSKKDSKTLVRAIVILEAILQEDLEFTPDPKMLKELEELNYKYYEKGGDIR